MFRQIADLPECGLVSDRMAEQCSLELAWTDDGHEDLDQRGFAGTVRPEQSEDLAFMNPHAHASEGLYLAAERLVNIINGDDGRIGHAMILRWWMIQLA